MYRKFIYITVFSFIFYSFRWSYVVLLQFLIIFSSFSCLQKRYYQFWEGLLWYCIKLICFHSKNNKQFHSLYQINNFVNSKIVNLYIQMSSKQNKPEVSIDAIKDVVKKFKNKGFQQLTHHDLALATVTVGFAQVCKQFGVAWNVNHQKQALNILKNSQYNVSWYGKVNHTIYQPILALCLRGDIEKIKQIIRTVSKNSRQQLHCTVDNFKRTALHLAVKQEFDILAEYLINQGFSVSARDRQLKTPLHYCKNQLISQILLKHNSSVLAKDNKNCTPVHYAAAGKDFKYLQILLKKSNIVNQADSMKKTPVFYAVFNNSDQQVNIFRVLIENGADVNAKDLQGRTPLHYAAEMGKTRCLPILLQKGASIDIRDSHNKTPLDLAINQKVRKIMTAYSENKGWISKQQQKGKRDQFSKIEKSNKGSQKNVSSQRSVQNVNAPIYSHELNQVSTWVRQKLFVLMKKLQEAGVKANWHIKRPYIYTGSWAQDIDGLQDLYETFLNANGPQAAMRTFNLLCPYQKPLPRVTGKAEQAFQSFFGEKWFSTDPVQKIRNMHSQSKVRNQLQAKIKENEDLQSQILGYRAQVEKFENMVSSLNQQISHYKKIQQQLQKERSKNTSQYSEMLKLMNQKQQLKQQLDQLLNGQQKTKILSNLVDQLRGKNQDLMKEMQQMKVIEAAARRKCGQIFLKALNNRQQIEVPQGNNLYDDDAIISLYELLKDNPPNLEKRFNNADRKGAGKLTIDQFTIMLEDLAMLPQDVMSMHRITGFAYGRKTLSLVQFKTLLQNRHKQRPMWQKNLIRKMKTIILSKSLTIEKFFEVIDKDGNGTIEASQLRKGLQQYNIFMNQNDWSNLFNLLDSDKSGEIDLNQLKNLMEQQKTGKLENLQIAQNQQEKKEDQEQSQEKEETEQKKKKEDIERQQQQAEQQPKEQEFSKQYEQEEQEQQKGYIVLDGQIKIQLPILQLPKQTNLDKAYIRFRIADDEIVKMADLTKPKLAIAVKFNIIQYKILDLSNLKIEATVFKTREFDQQSYLGQAVIQTQSALENPNTWAVNSQYQLQAEEFQKDVQGTIVIQVKWIPAQQQNQ